MIEETDNNICVREDIKAGIQGGTAAGTGSGYSKAGR
jgi:hypothetical protein